MADPARPSSPSGARVSALVLDALLLAHAGWCAGYLAQAWGLVPESWMTAHPRLALVALPLALLLQTTDASLCQRAHRIVRVDAEGAPAALLSVLAGDGRAFGDRRGVPPGSLASPRGLLCGRRLHVLGTDPL